MFDWVSWKQVAELVKEEQRMKKTEHSQLECGTIPKGTQISINGIPFVIQEDVKGNASQEYIDKTIQDQNDFFNGIGVVSGKCE